MACTNCGQEISDSAYVCPYCGARTPISYQQPVAPPANNDMAIAGLILAFFIPIVGLILSCIGLHNSKQMNGAGRGMSIAGIVISVALMVFAIIFVIVYVVVLIEVLNAVADGIGDQLNDPNTYAGLAAMVRAKLPF